MPRPRHLHIKERVDLVLGWLLSGLMGFAVLNVLWQVFTRYVLQSPSAYTDELSRYLLIWVGLLGASYAAGARMHLAIDLLPNRLSGRAQHALALVIDLLVFIFAFLVMLFGGFRLVALTLMLEQTSAALRIPLGYVYLALPLSGALIMFYAALFLMDHVRVLRGNAPLDPDAERSPGEAFAERVNELAGTASGRTSGAAASDPHR
jgi:TRAP-type C4-dicarboxylate transport system permease small subunit